MKKLLFIFMTVALTLSLFACGCTHKDNNFNGKCDKCDSPAFEKGVALVDEDNVAKFRFVIPQRLHTNVKFRLYDLVEKLAANGVEVAVVNENDTSKWTGAEVLVGAVTGRGEEYIISEKSLGSKGYVIKVINNKIVISGGSVDSLIDAIKIFGEDILKLDDEEISARGMRPSDAVEFIQSAFQISSFTICGNDIKDYTIARDPADPDHKTAALSVQTVIYENTGVWLPIVDLAEAGERSIVLNKIPRVYSDESFKVYTKDNQLIVDCAFSNRIHASITAYLNEVFDAAKPTGTLELSGVLTKRDVSFVTYKEFGAAGDGRTNDFVAIYNAHAFANAGGQIVKIDGKETYYISSSIMDKSPFTIPIKTNVNWGNAKITIDDSTLDLDDPNDRGMMTTPIFTVLPDAMYMVLTGEDIPEEINLSRGATNIGISFGYKAAIIPTYSGHKIYRRRTVSAEQAFRGIDMTEMIVIDKDGNVSPDTPIMWTYADIDSLTVQRLEDEPITLEGGIFTTVAPNESIIKSDGGSREVTYTRGFLIKRSDLTFKSVLHYVRGEFSLADQKEGLLGTSYKGFFILENVDSVTFDDCFFTARRIYKKESGSATRSYDLYATLATNLTFRNCLQHNFFITISNDGEITATEEGTQNAVLSSSVENIFTEGEEIFCDVFYTNLCKNLVYDSSIIASYTSLGCMGGAIKNSTVGRIDICGFGDFTVENSTQYLPMLEKPENALITLNEQYGASWDGKITFKNHKAYLHSELPSVVYYPYTNWYFGYGTVFPDITLDNLQIYNSETKLPFDSGTHLYLEMTGIFGFEPDLTAEKLFTKFAFYMYADEDGDGWVDNFDKNLDGTVGMGDEPYSPSIRKPGGVYSTAVLQNLNPVKPPSEIKVLNNGGADTDGDGKGDTGGFILSINRTDNKGSQNGGFFRGTKFYYTDEKFYTGTGQPKDEGDKAFLFN